jgi:hypothetical protein
MEGAVVGKVRVEFGRGEMYLGTRENIFLMLILRAIEMYII